MALGRIRDHLGMGRSVRDGSDLDPNRQTVLLHTFRREPGVLHHTLLLRFLLLCTAGSRYPLHRRTRCHVVDCALPVLCHLAMAETKVWRSVLWPKSHQGRNGRHRNGQLGGNCRFRVFATTSPTANEPGASKVLSRPPHQELTHLNLAPERLAIPLPAFRRFFER